MSDISQFVDFESIDQYIPNLDPRDEEQLFQESRLEGFNKSEGKLNDFSENSVFTAILRAFVFAGSENQFRNQQILTALVLKTLSSTGVQRRLGIKAVIRMKFTLTGFLSYAFQVDSGTEITDESGQIRFYTISNLTIAANTLDGFINAEAEFSGSNYNVDPFTINRLTTPLAFIAEVINPEDIVQKGIDEESLESAIARSALEIRTQALTSLPTYEDAIKTIYGLSAKVKAIYGLNAAKTGLNLGTIHCFVLGLNGEPISNNEAIQIYSLLEPRVNAGTTLVVSPMEVFYCQGVVIAKLKKDQDVSDAQDLLWLAYQQYFKTLEAGQTVFTGNIEYQFLDTQVLDYIDDFRINGFVDKIPMPNKWVIGFAWNIDITLVDNDNNVFNIIKGEQEPPEYDPE
jgi:Baseplate J-like protein